MPPRRLKRHLPEHDTSTVQEMGWSGTKNGALLKLAELLFEGFITLDRNLQYQQNLASRTIAIVVVLRAKSNRMDDLEPLIPGLKQALETIQPGEVVHVSLPEQP
jgi:hypothetical protein